MKEIIFLVLIGCSVVFCTQRCCRNNEVIVGKGYCGMSGERVIPMNCTDGRMVLRDVIVKDNKVSTQDSPQFVFVEDPEQYCLGKMYADKNDTSKGTVDVALVCFQQPPNVGNLETSGILTLISVFFLIATVAVYTYLPQLRDLQGLCYMCMCVSMALGFLSLGILQLSPGFTGDTCTATGFIVYTWMMATFFWMNIICINMYRAIVDSNHLKKTERQQYFFYSCYGWGATLLCLIIALIAQYAEGDHYKPGIGSGSCWFGGRVETWIYFYGPVAILLTANVLLFGMSSYNLMVHNTNRKYEVNTFNKLKYKFVLSLKLFLVMGLSWIFEIASFAHGEGHIIWRIMDTFNCLQGLVIFLLLVVFRKRAMQGMVNDNCCLCITRPIAEKLSPHDETDDQHILADDTVEVRLN